MSNAIAEVAKPEDTVTPTEEPSDDKAAGQESEDIDLDQADLDQARAAVKSDEAEPEGGEKEKEKEPDPEPEPSGDAAVAPPGEGEAQPEPEKPPETQKGDLPIAVPHVRFNEVTKQRDDALLQAAYWKGVADAKQSPQAGDATADAQVTPEAQLADLKTKKLELADQLDEGQLTQREYAEQTSVFEDQEFEIRKAMLAPPAADPADPGQVAQTTPTDLYLETVTAELEQAHPYLALMGDPAKDPVANERMTHLANEARVQLVNEGETITDDSRGTLLVRQRVAELSDAYGPVWFKDANVQIGQQPAADGQAKPAIGQDGLTATQRATTDKIAQAAAHPPDTLNVGTGEAQVGDAVADAQAKIESGKMTEDEIAALPEAVKAKIKGDSW